MTRFSRRPLPCLFAVAAAALPFVAAPSAGARTVDVQVVCSVGTPSISLTLQGEVPDRTAPGQTVQMTNVSGSIDWDGGVTDFPGDPYGMYFDLNAITLKAVGATTESASLSAGLPLQQGPFEIRRGTVARFRAAVPSGGSFSPVTTAGAGPVVLRLGSIDIARATVPTPTSPRPSELFPQTCTPPMSQPPVAVIPSTGELPGAPEITSVSPASGPIEGGNTVTIKGHGFTYAHGLKIDAPSYYGNRTVKVVDDETLEWTPGSVTFGQEVGLQVLGDFGTSAASTSARYRFGPPLEPAPTITSVSPRLVPVDATRPVFTITGTGLDRATKVASVYGFSDGGTILDQTATTMHARLEPAGGTWLQTTDSVYVQSSANCGYSPCGSANTPADDVTFYDSLRDFPGFPTAPSGLTTSGTGASQTLSWTPPSSTRPIESYRVLQDGDWYRDTTQPSVAIPGGSVDAHTYEVTALDVDGNRSKASDGLVVPGTVDDTRPPLKPTGLRVARRDGLPTVARFEWQLPDDYQSLAGYEVYVDGVKVRTVHSLYMDIPEMLEARSYTVKVRSIDTAGNGTFSDELTVPAVPCTVSCPVAIPDFSIAGTATIKALAKGSVPVSGALEHVVSDPTGGGAFSADLRFGATTANLTALGILPVKALLQFEQAEPVAGQLAGDQLSATAKLRIRVPKVMLFGLQLVNTATCQAKDVTTVPLKTIGSYSPTRTTTIGGLFAISDLTGCGALTGIVSPLTASRNNALLLKLTPKPAAAG